MEHLSVDNIYPEYKIWEEFSINSFALAQRLDALQSSHPILVEIKRAEEVGLGAVITYKSVNTFFLHVFDE